MHFPLVLTSFLWEKKKSKLTFTVFKYVLYISKDIYAMIKTYLIFSYF